MKSIGIIPARYASTRFPGKPLAKILNKTLLQRTFEQASLCKELSKIVIATDDERILNHAREFGAEAVMTSPACPNGTERIFEVVNHYPEYHDFDVVINIQGDEPCLNPTMISKMLARLEEDTEAVVVTPISLLEEKDLNNPSVVKCVKTLNNRALYFSRSPIPGYRHVGLYAYRKNFLKTYATLAPSPLQLSEDLEQLKILEYGYPMAVVVVEKPGPDVNEPNDIEKIEKYLWQQNSFS